MANSRMSNTHIKICGITNLEDALVAATAGADLLGFIFYPKSPRGIEPAVAAIIIAELKTRFQSEPPSAPHMPKTVGVFVNESVKMIRQIQAQAHFDYAQMHGDETPEMVEEMSGQAYKALRPASAEEAETLAHMYAPLDVVSQSNGAPGWMIDAYDPNAYGGTGHKADWHSAAQLAHQYPGLLLAGGLTPENVVQAIQTVQPWGVDVASGVEAAPGKKDHDKVRTIIKRVKEL